MGRRIVPATTMMGERVLIRSDAGRAVGAGAGLRTEPGPGSRHERAISMPARSYPYLLQEFLRQTGWPPPRDDAAAHRIQTALSFFHAHLQVWIKLPLDASDRGYRTHGPNPYAFAVGGRVTKLTGAMQGINFNQPVTTFSMVVGRKVRRYGKPGEPRGCPAPGLWYTDPQVPASALALPPDQLSPYGYEVISPVSVLASTAGDMLVDWNMKLAPSAQPVRGVDYHYRSGSGVQYVIPNAASVLRPL
jgi:hypothetical protein